MKLLINTASTYKGGGVQVAKSFIEECKKYSSHSYYVIIGPSLQNKINHDLFPDNFYFYKIDYRPATRIFSFKPTTTFFTNLEKRISPEVVFTTSGPAYWKPTAPHLIGYNLPHYIYSDSPFFNIISFVKKIKWKLKGRILKYFFRREGDTFVTQTDDVNNRLRIWLKTKKSIITVSNTCNQYFFNPRLFENKLPIKKKKEFRFLLLSAYYQHKNIEIITGIIDRLTKAEREIVQFVLTLESSSYKKLIPSRYRSNVLNVGPVKIEEAPSLYQECDAMFLPTLLECFSASYPEAMAMKKPILTSDLGFARSICDDAAIYFKPIDPEDASQKIMQLIQSPKLQKSLIERGLKRLKAFDTPTNRAKKYLAICEQLAKDES